MQLTPVILLALVPLLFVVLTDAAKSKENANHQSKSAALESSSKAKQSAKSSNAKKTASEAKAVAVGAEKTPHYAGAPAKKNSAANQMKAAAAKSAKAKQVGQSKTSEHQHSSVKASSAEAQKSSAALNKPEKQQHHLMSPLLNQEAAKKENHQQESSAKASHHQHHHAEQAAKAAAVKNPSEYQASYQEILASKNHPDSSAAKSAATVSAAEAKHGSETAPCPFCKTPSKSSVESESAKAHQKSSSSSKADEVKKEASGAIKRNHHYHHQTEYGQQPAYLTNSYHHSKPVYNRPNSYHHSKPVYNSYSHENIYSHDSQYGHNDYQQDTLIQANVIARLGDRTPLWLPRNDYYKKKDFPEGLNQLVNVGKERLVNYGRALRHRYQNLIKNLRLKDINTQSAADRVTVESALALLAGLLPPTGNQVWSSNYNADELARLWQPNAVSTVEHQRDWKLSTEAPCRTAELVENVTITEVPELKHFLAANREAIRRLEVLTGEDFTNDLSWIWIANVYDTYISEAEYFGPSFYPPRWADEQTLAVLRQANHLKFSVWGHDQAYLRLRGGPLLQEITENLIKAAKDEKSGRSLAIYSTLDSNIAIIEHSLGIFRGGQAGYGSGLLIELHRDNYNNNYNKEPVVSIFSVDVPSGVKISQVDLSRSERFRKHCYSGPNCPLSSFVVALQNHLLTRTEAEVKCNNS